jgi:predicted RNase H-like HicB family nuclease
MTIKPKKITELKFWVRIVVEQDEPGYHSYAPSLKGLHMGGDTPDEALVNAKEAAKLYLHSLLKHGDPIPLDVVEPESGNTTNIHNDHLSSKLEEIKVRLE